MSSWILLLEGRIERRREASLDKPHDARGSRMYSAASMAMWEVSAPLLERYCRGRVLDAGAGSGGWRRTIERFGDRYESLDVSARGAHEPTWVGDLCDMPQVPSGGFDTVVCHQVLEHVREPWRAAEELARVLRPGGALIVSVPHLSRYHELPHDYFRYTANGLEAIFARAGLETLELCAYGGPLSLAHHQLSVVLHGLTPEGLGLAKFALWLNAAPGKASAALDRRLLGRRLPLGIVAVFRRP
jgi:SAM-dependent methyltransferase